MNDKILVRLKDIDNPNVLIANYYTTNWSEVYKTYYFMRDNEVATSITIATDPDNPSSYDNKEFFIREVTMQFGSQIGLNSLDVFVKAV